MIVDFGTSCRASIPSRAHAGALFWGARMEITVDGAAVKVDGADPVPYEQLSDVNRLIGELHLATPPELLGSPACKACPGEGRRRYATNAIAYRRARTSLVVLVNLCAEDIRTEQIWAGIFGWVLHVLPEPLALTAQYLFDVGHDEDRALLEGYLDDHRDVLEMLAGDDRETADPAAARGNASDAGIAPEVALSSPPEAQQRQPSGNQAESPAAARTRNGRRRTPIQ